MPQRFRQVCGLADGDYSNSGGTNCGQNIATLLVSDDLPPPSGKRLPARVPVFRLGRLATSKTHQGQGIGEFMLFDAIDRVIRIASEVGGVGLVVDAKPQAVDFYKRYGFETMADHPLHLFLLI